MTTRSALPSRPERGPDVVAPVDEHDDLRSVTRAVLDKHGSIEQVRDAAATPAGYSVDLWRILASDVGVTALAVPEDLGGLGMGLRELAVVLEECGATLAPEPVLASAVLGVQTLLQADDPAAVADLLASGLSGERVLTLAWADAGALQLSGPPGALEVRGVVRRVLQGAVADVLVAPAVIDGSVVLVAVELADAVATDLRVLDTTRRQADVTIAGAPARVVVGQDGFARAAARLATLRRVAVASEHAGMIGDLLDLTVDYVRERQQFGRPIGSFQAVKHRLADLLVDRERARSAARFAAAVAAADPDAAELPSTVAAAICSDAVVRVAHEAVQLHGGIGFTWEHRAHLYVRRALGDEGLFGSARAHRSSVANLVGV
jgi:alkylation response protein AidB-like acyl-CoA dehydrogenase